jgi:ABC-2 type transport system permease protein
MNTATQTKPESTSSSQAWRAEDVRAALGTAPKPEGASALSAVLAFGWRGMLKIKHVPEQLFDVTLTPVLFTLMFTYLFGGAVAGSTGEYLTYIMPGILSMSVVFTTVYSGVSLTADMSKGVIDRFRSLPSWRPAPLVGALIGDSVRYLVAAAVVIVLGLILGFRPAGGPLGVIAAVALVAFFSFGLSWIFACLGLIMRTPQAMMNVGFSAIFPITFLSSAFVDPDTLPSALEAFVVNNPVSHLIEACRGLMEGTGPGSHLFWVVLTTVVLTAVFAPLTARLYGRKG